MRRSSDSMSIYRGRAEQVADYLRALIRKGSWQEALPAERQLASQLGVGRNTLRAALATLEREGLLGERSQHGTLLAKDSRSRSSTPQSVGLVFTNRSERVVGKGLVYLDEIRCFFARKEIDVIVHRAPIHRHSVAGQFKQMIAGSSRTFWILMSPTEEIQQWCMEHRVRSLMVGDRVSEQGIPAVCINTAAACRHAVGRMLARGHRRLALILPFDQKGGDYQSRASFLEAIAESPHREEVTALVETHSETKASVCQAAERLLSLANRPTAWLICRPGHYITIHSYLMKKGIAIPGEISLISRDTDIYLNDLIPDPCRYVSDPNRAARTVARLASRLMDEDTAHSQKRKTLRIVPEFVEGETLGLAR